MWCKVSLISLTALLIAVLVSGWLAVRNLGRFLDVSQDDIVANVENADAIVVMGGEGGRFMRTQRAIELYRDGLAPAVVFSGGTLLSAGLDCSSTQLSMDAADRLGLAAEAVIISGDAQSTWDEGVNLARLSEEYGWRSIVLVTDRFHTRRSLRTLQEAMPGHLIYATAPVDPYYDSDHWWDNEHSMVFVVNELLKLGYYWKVYGIQPFG